MNKRTTAILLLVTSGVIALFIFWFLSNYRYENREYKTAMSPLAAQNPFLAAERYLKQTGTESESVSGRGVLLDLPPEDHLIFINNMTGNLPSGRENDLIDWVSQGGHLLLTAHRFWDEELNKGGNTLLDRYAVRLMPVSDESDNDTTHQNENGPTEEPVIHETVRFMLMDSNNSYTAKFRKNRILEGGDDSKSEISGDHILQIQLGQGVLTVLSDNDFLQNHLVGEKDHALLLSVLSEDREKVWFLYSSNMPALPLILWEKAPHLVICLILLTIFILLYLRERSGPLKTAGPHTGRNIMEHLEASGYYLYGIDQGKQMMNESRTFITSDIHERFMFLSEKSRREKSIWISEKTGLSESAVHDALYKKIQEDGDFVKRSSLLQKLMTSLKRK